MSKKILLTCPPMIGLVDRFKKQFDQLGWSVTVPDFVQVMTEEALIEVLPQHDGWIIGDDPATAAVFEAGVSGQLKAAVKWGIGTDNVDFEAAKHLKIPIINTPNVFGAEVADLAMHYVTGLARRAYEIDRAVRGGGWPKPAGISLAGRRVAVVGFGDIGRAFAKRAAAADMEVCVYDPGIADPSQVYPYVLANWPDDLSNADFIVLVCALTPSSREMINASLLAELKPSAMLVNVARGGLIDEDALVFALQQKALAGVALDVFAIEPLPEESPLRAMPQCIFGTHNGSNTVDAVERASNKAIQELDRFLHLDRH